MSFSNAMSTDQLMVWLNSRGVSQKDRDLLKGIVSLMMLYFDIHMHINIIQHNITHDISSLLCLKL